MIFHMTSFHPRRDTFFIRRPALARASACLAATGILLATSACNPSQTNSPSGSSGASENQSSSSSRDASAPQQLNVTVENTHPWDKSSFTQGLETDRDGTLVVGTGQYKQSRIYRTTVDGKQSDSHSLPDQFFGEGLTITGDTVWQLTWKENVAIKRKASDLSEISQAKYDGEGWGLCAQQDRLVMSDGSGTLSFRDPETFEKTGQVEVTKSGQPTTMLNELECAPDGSVWANVWQTNEIYRIDPNSGKVTGVADLTGKLPAANRGGADVLNGIARVPSGDSTAKNAANQRFYVTGKWWDELYEVTFS